MFISGLMKFKSWAGRSAVLVKPVSLSFQVQGSANPQRSVDVHYNLHGSSMKAFWKFVKYSGKPEDCTPHVACHFFWHSVGVLTCWNPSFSGSPRLQTPWWNWAAVVILHSALRIRGFMAVCDCNRLCSISFGFPGKDLILIRLSSCGLGALSRVFQQVETPNKCGEGRGLLVLHEECWCMWHSDMLLEYPVSWHRHKWRTRSAA